MKSFLKNILVLPLLVAMGADQKKNRVGDQAIIEGVMMRGKKAVSWAVKPFGGETVVESMAFTSLGKRYPILRWPVFRGAISMYESLTLGFKALSRSAELVEDKKTPADSNGKAASFMSIATVMLSLVFSFGIFLYLPLKILSFFLSQRSAFEFNILAGSLRIGFFVLYLIAISLWKDIRRIFEYHGAEHKSIFAYEAGNSLTVEAARPYPTLHPRCGTSFILLVSIICILLFGIIDAVIIRFIGPYPSVLARTVVHLALIPFVSGMSYEVLRFSDRNQHIPPVRWLIKPGLWLQYITTKEPSDEQIEIALKALKAVV